MNSPEGFLPKKTKFHDAGGPGNVVSPCSESTKESTIPLGVLQLHDAIFTQSQNRMKLFMH